MSRRPLAWRLGLLLGIPVLVVLLLTGLVVNRVVSGGFESVVTTLQQQRLEDAADTVADRIDRPVRLQAFVRRLATQLGGSISVEAADGTTLAAFGRAPDGTSATYATPVNVDGAEVATLNATLPGAASVRGFLPLFNVTLLVAGLVALVGIVLLSTVVAGWVTRPLRDVADAARRLEAGDPTARAMGGDDRESAELAQAFNAMAERLERSEELRRRAASDLAHDLATPATVLVSQLQAMSDGLVPLDRAGIEAARIQATALGELVGSLDDLATAEAAPLHVSASAFDVGALARELATGLEGLARDSSVRMAVDDPGGVTAWADRGHVSRALRNVVANAVRHSPRDGLVRITVAHERGAAIVRVIDAGTGIAPDDVAHVFERFYRADPARSTDPITGRPTGSGLGLTIARELLAANHGTIAVEATGPTGTTFRLELPLATDDTDR